MDPRPRSTGSGDVALLPRAQRLLLALIAHSPVCMAEYRRLWECLAGADPCVHQAEFDATLNDLISRGLAEAADAERLVVTQLGRAALEAEELSARRPEGGPESTPSPPDTPTTRGFFDGPGGRPS